MQLLRHHALTVNGEDGWPGRPPPGASCSFTGKGTGTLRWAFGSGTSGTGPSVTTKYASIGSYMVRLTDSQVPATSDTRLVTCSKVSRKIRCTT